MLKWWASKFIWSKPRPQIYKSLVPCFPSAFWTDTCLLFVSASWFWLFLLNVGLKNSMHLIGIKTKTIKLPVLLLPGLPHHQSLLYFLKCLSLSSGCRPWEYNKLPEDQTNNLRTSEQSCFSAGVQFDLWDRPKVLFLWTALKGNRQEV